MGASKSDSDKIMVVINQPGAIGDLIFLEPMYRHLMNKNGEKPVVVVHDHLLWIQEYIDSADFLSLSKFPGNNLCNTMFHDPTAFLNMRYANQILRKLGPHDHHDLENMMLDKYRLMNLDPEMWKTIKLNFKDSKSSRLMEDLKIMQPDGTVDKEYMLINQYSQAGWIKIDPQTDMKKVRMTQRLGYTVIDWHLVMQMAHENHHVSTSTFYIMQAIQNQFHFDTKVCIYPRPNVDGLRGISQLKPDFKFQRMS